MRLVFEKRKTTSISALILVPMVSFAVSLFLTALLLFCLFYTSVAAAEKRGVGLCGCLVLIKKNNRKKSK